MSYVGDLASLPPPKKEVPLPKHFYLSVFTGRQELYPNIIRTNIAIEKHVKVKPPQYRVNPAQHTTKIKLRFKHSKHPIPPVNPATRGDVLIELPCMA